FLTKPESITKNRDQFKSDLEMRIKALVDCPPQTTSFIDREGTKHSVTTPVEKINTIVIGASTGGPKVISSLIQSLPSSLSLPVFIVQHMPKGFTASFAERLNIISSVSVVEAEDGMPIERGTVYIAPGGYHLVIENQFLRLLEDR